MKKYLKESIKYLLRSEFVIRKYIDKIERLYEMTPKELEKRNEIEFIKLFRRAYEESPFYRNLYNNAGIRKEDISCLGDIKKLPVITKSDIKEHTDELLIAPKWRVIVNHTSGTTGSPLKVYEDWSSIWREQAYLYCYRKRCGFTYGQPLVSLRGNLEKSDIYLKVHVSNTLFLSSYNINQKNVKIYYQQIIKHKPIAIEGYPSSLYALALLLRDNNMYLNIPLAFTSSETLLDYQRSLIENQMNTNIYDFYGNTERTIQLCENVNHNGYYESPGYSINEFVEDGEITTSLINESFPLIRYKGNDVMELSEEGKTHRVKRIQGRKSSCLIGKDGSRYSSALLTRVFKDIVTIDEAQFVQKKLGIVDLNVVVGNKFSDSDMQSLRDAVEFQLDARNFDLKIRKVSKNDLIYSKSGKFNYILNLMPETWG